MTRSMLRAQPRKVNFNRAILDKLYWVLIGINVSTSAWSLKQNAAFTSNTIPSMLGSTPNWASGILSWIIPLLAAVAATAIGTSIIQLFVTNPLGIPTLIEEIIGNVQAGKAKQMFASLIATLLFILIVFIAYRSYIFDINSTAAGLGFPTLGNGLMRHSLNFVVFAIVGGSEIIAVLLNGHEIVAAISPGGNTSGARQSTNSINRQTQIEYPQTPDQ